MMKAVFINVWYLLLTIILLIFINHHMEDH